MRLGVSYVRVSTEEQAEAGRSLEVQERENRAYAARHGIRLERVFTEAGSAYRWDAREQFDEMCRWLEKHPEVEVLVVWKVIRAVRNLTDWAYLTEGARNGRGIDVISVTEGFPQTTSGRLMGGMSALFGRWQSQVISEQVKANMQAWAERGVYPSRAPVGYRNRPRKHPKERGLGVEPDEQAPKVKELFEMYASGLYTLDELHEQAKRMKLKTWYGNIISRSKLAKMLCNPFYKGFFRWKGISYRGVHEPLISPELWAQVQRVIEQRGNGKGKSGHRFPLKGLLRCRYCGHHLTAQFTVNRHGKRYIYYRCYHKPTAACRKSHRQELLFERAAEVLKPLQFTDEELAALERYARAWFRDRRGSVAGRIQALEHERQRLEELLSRGVEAYLAGKIDDALWQRKEAEWQKRLEEIDRERSALAGASRTTIGEMMRFVELVADLHRSYREAGGLERAGILKAVTSNLLVGRESVEPIYKRWAQAIAERPARPVGCTNPIDFSTLLPHVPMSDELMRIGVGGSR